MSQYCKDARRAGLNMLTMQDYWKLEDTINPEEKRRLSDL